MQDFFYETIVVDFDSVFRIRPLKVTVTETEFSANQDDQCLDILGSV